MITNILVCPDCQIPIHFDGNETNCRRCKKVYKIVDNIYVLLPSLLSDNKVKENEIYNQGETDNAWYNNRVWYYLIHLSSHFIRFEKDILPKIKGPKVLELGGGNGWASMITKRTYPKFEIYASDVAYNSLKIQGKQMSNIMEIKPDAFIVCDAEKLPFKNNSIDTIYIMASLHHFLDIAKALKEIKRVLKPGGVFLAIDGTMPMIARKIFKNENSERTKLFGILEQNITFSQWIGFLNKAKIPTKALKLNFDTRYLHSYATNEDEKHLINNNWLFNILKEFIYGALLSKLNQEWIIKLKLTEIFPAGIVIEYYKNR